MRVIELGNYIAPAYAGMLLSEQGHEVRKWVNGKDPILTLNRGADLWAWINYGKRIEYRAPSDILDITDCDAIIDNFKPSTLAKWNIDPQQIAQDKKLIWVSIRSEVDEVSFDILAQARSWMEYADHIPFYVGDMAAGLWTAFKVTACTTSGHYVIGHASCMQKMVEGELMIDRTKWDTDEYRFHDGQATVSYRGERYTETPKDRDWKLKYLNHRNGRIVI